ncbi:MAG: hypothetical protein ACXVCP_13455 [Bdellovibrio sp.]
MLKFIFCFGLFIVGHTAVAKLNQKQLQEKFAVQMLSLSTQISTKIQTQQTPYKPEFRVNSPDLENLWNQFGNALSGFKENGGNFNQESFPKNFKLLKIISTAVNDRKLLQDNIEEKLKAVGACSKFRKEEIQETEQLIKNIQKDSCYYQNYGSKEIVGFYRKVSGTKIVEKFSLFGTGSNKGTFVKQMDCLVPLYEKNDQLYSELENFEKDAVHPWNSIVRPEMRIAKESTDDNIIVESYTDGHWFKNHVYKNCGPAKTFFKNYILSSISPAETTNAQQESTKQIR